MTRSSVSRRMGPVGSDNWHAMLDAAEATLLEEGYGALTSRRIAERMGVKQRLVYYYFASMDELVVETFRRMAARELERMRELLRADMPMRRLWDICIHTTDSRVTSEFMALAHRNEGLRQEVVRFIEDARSIQAQAIRGALEKSGAASSLDPDSFALVATGLALALTRESAIGVASGHASLHAMIAAFLDRAEPPG